MGSQGKPSAKVSIVAQLSPSPPRKDLSIVYPSVEDYYYILDFKSIILANIMAPNLKYLRLHSK